MKVNEFKRGQTVEIDGDLWTILKMDQTKPGKGPAYYQMSLKNLYKGNTVQRRYNGDDELKFAFLESREFQYLYQDGDDYVFMDLESYEQIMLPGSQVKEEMKYVRLNSVVKVRFYEETPIGLDIPASVVLKVSHTGPSAKGDTVKNVTKPAVLETGAEIKVPAHIEKEEFVKVDTRTGEFIGRASEGEIPSDI